jgi:transketolase
MTELQSKARELRRMIVRLSHATRTAHLGSALSCADILVAAYSGGLNCSCERPDDPERDRLVFGKGHCATALVCALARHGYCSFDELLTTFNMNGGLQEHPNYRCVPGVENASGSLGHALPIGLGMALAARIQGNGGRRVCVVMGDGECNEGSVWEAAMLAGGQRAANLCAVVDFNRWQATGRSCDITALEPLADKWRAFGWETVECDGHDPDALRGLLRAFGKGGRPFAIVAHTVKGKGVSFMEDDNNWHYRIPNDAELAGALAALGEA